LGFPYAKDAYYINLDLQIEVHLVKGLERRFYPIIQKHSLPNASKFFQPIFYQNKKIDRFLFDNEYVHNNSIDWEKGIGKIFHEFNGTTTIYPREKTNTWLPPDVYELADFLPKINQQVYDFQIDVCARSASLDRLPIDERRYVRKQIGLYRSANNSMINAIKKLLGKNEF
jgi:hypothetical protein